MGEEVIARNINKLRKKRKITLEKLADLTGLTKGYLSKIERAKKAPPYSTLNKIAMALGVDAAFFLEENPPGTKDLKISFHQKSAWKRHQSSGVPSRRLPVWLRLRGACL